MESVRTYASVLLFVCRTRWLEEDLGVQASLPVLKSSSDFRSFCTGLFFECFVLFYRTVAALLSAGADSCARDVQGYTGLHMLQKEYLGSGERLWTSSPLLQELGFLLGVCMDVLKCTCQAPKRTDEIM